MFEALAAAFADIVRQNGDCGVVAVRLMALLVSVFSHTDIKAIPHDLLRTRTRP